MAAAIQAGAAGPAQVKPAPPARGQPIREIRFEAHDVFDLDQPGENGALFRLGNALHAKTKNFVVAHELLFGVGDPYDPALLSETERNLRRLPFLREAELLGVATASGAVVIVRTWDAWTLEPVARFQRAGGVNDTRLGAADRNVFGYGKSLSLLYSGSGATIDRTLSYRDPQLLGRRLDWRLSAGNSTHDQHYEMSLARPFYASIARSSLSGRAAYAESWTSVYQGLTPVGTAARRARAAGLTYGYAFEASTRRTRRALVGLSHDSEDFEQPPGQPPSPIPPPARRASLELGAEYQDNDFIKQKRIQKLSRVEDFNLGFGLLASLKVSPRWSWPEAADERLKPQLTVRKGFSSVLGHVLLLRGDYSSTYVNGGNGLRLATLDVQYFCRYFPRHTVGAHAAIDHGWRLDGPSQLGLGEDSGLRGYRARQFQGDRRLLFNLEERVFLFENFAKLVDGGAVVFFDSGYVWQPDRGMALSDLKSSCGVGLRFGATRSAGNDPLRIDLARALDDNRFPSRWTLSIKAGHSF